MTDYRPLPKELANIGDTVFSRAKRHALQTCFETQTASYSIFRSNPGRILTFAAYYQKLMSVTYVGRLAFSIKPTTISGDTTHHAVGRQIDLLDLMNSSLPIKERVTQSLAGYNYEPSYRDRRKAELEAKLEEKDKRVSATFPGLLTEKSAFFISNHGPLIVSYTFAGSNPEPDTRPPVPLDQFLKDLKSYN